MNSLVIDMTHGGVKIAVSLAKKDETVYAYDIYNTLKSVDKKMLAVYNVKIIDLEREIDVDIDKLVDIKQGIIELINTAEKIEFRNLLKLRYLDYKSWFEISIIINCKMSEVHIIHLKALQSIRYDIVLA